MDVSPSQNIINKGISTAKKALTEMNNKNWETIFENGPEVVQRNKVTGEFRSSMYDMAHGETYWEPGNAWAPGISESPKGDIFEIRKNNA